MTNQIKRLFIFFALFLAFFPIIATTNEVLSRLAQELNLTQYLQNLIVPIEVKMIASLLSPFNLDLTVKTSTIIVNGNFAQVTWNCIGWQSMLILIVSLFIGLQGNFTLGSKIEVILIGILGTYLINLLRMALIITLLGHSKYYFAFFYHDVVAVIVTFIWLFFFWWVVYSFVLEERTS